MNDVLNLTMGLSALALLLSPERLSRRQRFARWLRKLLRRPVEPRQPRLAVMIEEQGAALTSLLDAAIGDE